MPVSDQAVFNKFASVHSDCMQSTCYSLHYYCMSTSVNWQARMLAFNSFRFHSGNCVVTCDEAPCHSAKTIKSFLRLTKNIRPVWPLEMGRTSAVELGRMFGSATRDNLAKLRQRFGVTFSSFCSSHEFTCSNYCAYMY